MTYAHLLFAVATAAYILPAIQFEERDLVREHGASYEDYRRRVPILIPFTRSATSARCGGWAPRRSRRSRSRAGLADDRGDGILAVGICGCGTARRGTYNRAKPGP